MPPRHIACFLTGVILSVNGIAMLLLPASWYALMPGVLAGPLNLHFVRGIGCAGLSGWTFVWLWRNPRAWPAAPIQMLAIEPDGQGARAIRTGCRG